MKISNHCLSAVLLLLLFLFPVSAITQVLFQKGESLDNGISAEVACVADVNNDGLDDIVAASGFEFGSPLQYLVFVYLQSPSGTFPAPITYPYSPSFPGLRAMAIGDVNNDMLNDVIIGYGDSIGIYFQNATGTLEAITTYYSGASVDDVKTGDLNSDGLDDIVVSHWNDPFILVFYQTVNGFTTGMYTKPLAGYDEIEIGDVNADGLLDVVFMAGQVAGGIHIFTQNAGGTLNPYVSYFPDGVDFPVLNGIAIGDLNQDGANDVTATIGGNVPYAFLVIWYQDTLTNLLKPSIHTPTYEIPSNIDIADFACDGSPEIFISHGGWNAISVWPPDPNGQYTDYDVYYIPIAQQPKPEALAAGDINNDGKMDIVAVADNRTIQLLYNISIPTTFTDIDTSVVMDTISNYQFSMYYFTITLMDTVSNFIIVQTDSFQVVQSYRQDSIRTDSIFVRTGILCGGEYNDVITDTFYSFTTTISSDTLFWSSTIDTFLISGVSDPQPTALNIHPNPFNNQLIVHYASDEPSVISFYDCLGRLTLRQDFTNSATIYTAHIANGIYFYTLSTSKEIVKTGMVVRQ